MSTGPFKRRPDQIRNQGSTARSKVINNQNQREREDFSSAVMRGSLPAKRLRPVKVVDFNNC
jgi:hypothetical protein